MSYIYLASPYTHPDAAVRHARYDAVTACAAILMRAGCTVYSPITHSHRMAEAHNLPTDWGWWEPHCLTMLNGARNLTILCLDGWSESVGIQAELAHAKNLQIAINYLAEDFIERAKTSRLAQMAMLRDARSVGAMA